MRDAIAWSHDLLDEAGQRRFRRLAVFTGGFTLAAATSVLSDDEDVRGGVGSLLEAHLVERAERAGADSRFTMLETVREFGLDRLAASSEEAEIRAQHARWFLARSDQEAALRHYQAALAVARRMLDVSRISRGLANVAGMLAPLRAAVLARGATPMPAIPDPALAEEAWAAGRKLPIDAAVTLAVAATAVAPPAPDPFAMLSAREREVLRLLIDGRLSCEMADTLSLSERTVDGHVQHILAKLGVASRTAAVVLALRHGFR